MNSLNLIIFENVAFYWVLGGIVGGFFFLVYFTKSDFRPLMSNLLFLILALVATFFLEGWYNVLILPFFILALFGLFSRENFSLLFHIEENFLFASEEPQIWSKLPNPPELSTSDLLPIENSTQNEEIIEK